MSSYFWFILLLTVTAVSSECPQDCICSPIHNQQTEHHNHAKCSTLSNIKENVSYPSLHSLDLSSTNLETVPMELELLQNVTHLDLSNNRLVTLTKLNNGIRSLDLSHNRLTSTELVKISMKIRILNLSFNEITYLPLDVMNFKSLKSINLIGNRIDCSCETLTVRDWLHRKSVWMSKHTICASPLEIRHQPWDKISKNDVCSADKQMETENKIQIRNSRELDLSDFIAEEFLPFDDSHSILKRQVPDYDNLNDEDDGSGNEKISATDDVADNGSGESSGDSNVNENSGENSGENTSLPIDDYEDEEIEESEGSGSGAGLISFNADGGEVNHTTDEPDLDDGDVDDVTYASVKLNIFGGLRVADAPTTTTVAPTETVDTAVVQEIKQTEQNPNEKVMVDPNIKIDNKPENIIVSDDPKKADESSSTFILLAILGVLLVSLIVYVIFKRRKNRRRSSYNNNDAENIREIEMLDMKKNSNGKQQNVEIIPLMPKKEQPKIEKGLGDQNKEINSNIQPLHAANYPKIDSVPTKQNDVPQATTTPTALPQNNNNLSQVQPEEPTQEIPKTLDEIDDNTTSKPIENGHNGHLSDDEVFVPEEPTVKRYSPVYSPETGRVKIKLTETPKPKTPMLVTRSRSNAGAYITTPNLNIRSTSANGQ